MEFDDSLLDGIKPLVKRPKPPEPLPVAARQAPVAIKPALPDLSDPFENRTLAGKARKELDDARKFYVKPQNLCIFARNVLNYPDISDDVHGPCRDLIAAEPQSLHLLPRGHLKSTFITISYVIQRILENPNVRIYITNAVLALAQDFLREIKGHMENNQTLRSMGHSVFYRNPQKDSIKWTEDEIIVKREKNHKEATITVGAIGAVRTGAHFELIIYDDLVNTKNIHTPELIQDTLEWYRMTRPLLEPNGKRIIVGTRYDFSDLYGTLLKLGIPCYSRQAIENDVPLLPTRFTMEELDDIRKEDAYVWSSQYMNDPIDPSTAVFKREFLQFWPPPPLPRKANVYVLVDLAISRKDSACDTAIMVIAYDQDGNVFILEDCSGKFTPTETVDHLYRIDEKYHHPAIGIERQQLEMAMEFWLQEAAKEHGTLLTYYKLKPDMDKERRIRAALHPLWENKRIFLGHGMVELEMQFLRFPRYNMRDRIDALAYIPQMVARPTSQYREPRRFKWDYGNMWEKLGDKMNRVKEEPVQEKTSLLGF